MAHLIQVAGDLFCYRALLFAGGGDLGAHLQHGVAVAAQLVDVLAHLGDELLAAGGAPDRLLHDVVKRPCAGLQLFNHLLDLHRGLLGAAGEGAYLVCHHGKAASLLAGPGGLDGGVERQQVGLLGDGVDDVDHLVDAVGIVGQPLDGAGGVAYLVRQGTDGGNGARHPLGAVGRLFAGLAGLQQGVVGIAGHFADRRRHLLHGGGQGVHVLALGAGQGLSVTGVLAELVGGHGECFGGLLHQFHYLVLAIGEAVYAARQDGELVPHREEVEAEGEIPVRHRLQRLVGGVEGPGDEGHQIVGDEGKQGGQHGYDGEGRPLSIPHGKIAGVQGAADETGLTGLGTILKAISLLGQTGAAGRRQGELGRQGEGGLLGDQLGRGLYPLLELIQPDLHLLIMAVCQQVPGEKGDEQQGAPEGDEKFFADREVNEITVNPPEFNFFHNGIASCKGERVSCSLSPWGKIS
ncbi:hypothetical protein D3C77_161510 [compost metagenome]